MYGQIVGTGAYRPDKVLDNVSLSQVMDTSDEWIRERTGIVKRHIAKEESTVFMGTEAARIAIKNAGMVAEQIDMILFSTISSNVVLPCAACAVQNEIGVDHAVCFDINAACSGFLFAYNTAQAYIHAGLVQNVLVIGAERMSSLIDWKDRGTAILFGDGAGAVILKADEHAVFQTVMYSDGQKGNALTLESRHQHNWLGRMAQGKTHLRMDGKEVFQFAIKKVPEAVEELLIQKDLEVSDIDYFILHQANKRIISSVAKRLKCSMDKFPMNLQEYGNTSSASIPLLLSELSQSGRLKKGQKMVMAGFGGGLSWGATYLEW